MLAAAAAALGLVFIAELGDKTLLTVLLLASRAPAAPVLLGACAAFLVHTTIAVAFGQLFALLPHAWVRAATVVAFAVFGILLLVQAPEEGGGEAKEARGPFALAFGFIFLAEWGDMTQITTAALVARAAARLGRLRGSLAVFAGATGGLWLGTILAVLVGRTAGHRLPERVVRRVAGGVFLAFAALTALGKGA